MDDCEDGGSSSSVVYAFRFREAGVTGLEGGGVGSMAWSGMTLYRPSFDRKSWRYVSITNDEYVFQTNRYATAGAYTGTSDKEVFM